MDSSIERLRKPSFAKQLSFTFAEWLFRLCPHVIGATNENDGKDRQDQRINGRDEVEIIHGSSSMNISQQSSHAEKIPLYQN